MRDVNHIPDQRTPEKAMSCAQQLLELLGDPNFNVADDEQCRRADALWIKAQLEWREVQT